MLSFIKCHVSKGNIKYEAANAKKRELHNSPVSSTTNLVPIKKQRPTGTEYTPTVSTG